MQPVKEWCRRCAGLHLPEQHGKDVVQCGCDLCRLARGECEHKDVQGATSRQAAAWLDAVVGLTRQEQDGLPLRLRVDLWALVQGLQAPQRYAAVLAYRTQYSEPIDAHRGQTRCVKAKYA